MENESKKYDDGKTEWNLVPLSAIEPIAKVLMYGRYKYGRNTWQGLSNFEDRYFAATMRHLVAYQSGELIDSESGLSHLSHAATNLIFMLWNEQNNK